jgi:carbon storage regulator
MLVIRRRSGESLLIGDNVEIEILEITASQVKLGIRAPKEVAVLRREIYLTAEQNRVASREVPLSRVDHLRGSLRAQPMRSTPEPAR